MLKVKIPVMLTRLIGKEYTHEVETDLKQRFPQLRVHKPNTRVTTEYDPGRLNMIVDKNNKIVRLSWG